MSLKVEKPTLSGQRIKTRKRDEKEKYDPAAFRDAVVLGLNEAGTNLESVAKFLDLAGGKLDYRRYAEALLDVLFAGGILAPGGFVVEHGDSGNVVALAQACVFNSTEKYEDLKAYYGIFYKLIRRYKYIEKSFQEELNKLVLFLKGFSEDNRHKLATIYGIFFAQGLGNAQCLGLLFEDHLVKDGLALEFATNCFQAWLREKDIAHVSSTLKRAGIECKLMELLPFNKRTQENFENHFKAAGLGPIIDFQRAKTSQGMRRDLSRQLEEMIKDDEPVKEMIPIIKEYVKKYGIPEHDAVVMTWNTIMNAVEWNKKEDLLAEQALKHLKTYMPLLSALTTAGRSEVALIVKVQEFCYDNMNFLKVFQKIVVLFYKADILGEDAILKWYKEAHVAKGKTHFLDQMKKFVEWLQNAEEEESEEEEEEEEEEEDNEEKEDNDNN